MSLLAIDNVSLSFAGVHALSDVSLSVDEGELFAIIGPNGAGKTSLFNCISGVYRPQKGSVRVADKNVLGMPPDDIARLGVARMFQNLALFDQLTVQENMLLGRHQLYQTGWFSDLFWLPKSRIQEIEHRKAVEVFIDFLDLERYRKMPVAILPYGVLKRVELGRALCMKPKLLLLDEPAAGLNQEETEQLARYMLDIKEELKITQVLIEHELRFVFELADRVKVLDFGRGVAEGAPDEIRHHPAVIEAYVGGVAESDGDA